MKKSKRILLFFLFFTSSLSFVGQSSLTENSTTFINSNVEKSEEKGDAKKNKEEEKPELSPDFDEFEKIVQDTINFNIAKIVESVKQKIDEKLENLNKSQKFDESFFNQLATITSLQKIFSQPLEEIQKNPKLIGLNTNFLKAISTQKQFDRGSIDLDDENKFKNLVIGKDNNSDYNEVENQKKQISDEQKNLVNSYKKEKIKEIANSYFSDLSSDLEQQFFISIQEKIQKGKDYDVLIEKEPPKIFIENKGEKLENIALDLLTKKLLIFDLEENQKLNQESSQKQGEEDIPEESISEIAKELDEENESNLPENLKPAVERMPELQPQIADSDNLNLEKFFFNNPINTRFEYKVLTVDGANASVQVSDKIDEKNSKTYQAQIEILPNDLAQSWKSSYEEIKKIMLAFYKLSPMGENLHYEKVSFSSERNYLFNMVFVAQNANYQNEFFLENQKKLVNYYRNDPQNFLYKLKMKNLFLQTLKKYQISIVNSADQKIFFWNMLYLINQKKIDLLSGLLSVKQQKFLKILESFYQKNNLNFNTFRKVLLYLNLKNQNLKYITQNQVENVNLNYDKLISLYGQIVEPFDQVFQLSRSLFSSGEEDVSSNTTMSAVTLQQNEENLANGKKKQVPKINLAQIQKFNNIILLQNKQNKIIIIFLSIFSFTASLFFLIFLGLEFRLQKIIGKKRSIKIKFTYLFVLLGFVSFFVVLILKLLGVL